MSIIGEVSQILTALAAVGSMALSWRNSRKIEVIRHATNSMKDELVAEVRKASFAAGEKSEADKDSKEPPKKQGGPVKVQPGA